MRWFSPIERLAAVRAVCVFPRLPVRGGPDRPPPEIKARTSLPTLTHRTSFQLSAPLTPPASQP
jgi:hypothetical protein